VAALDQTIARVREYLDGLGVVFETADGGTLKVDAGTTAVYIHVEDVAARRVVSLMAPVLVGVDAGEARLCELLTLNSELRFGKFSWHADRRTVTVEYELLGDFLDRDELAVALQAVGEIADTCDERLQPLLGGRRPHVDH
jgi:hypothetical protein